MVVFCDLDDEDLPIEPHADLRFGAGVLGRPSLVTVKMSAERNRNLTFCGLRVVTVQCSAGPVEARACFSR